MFRPSMPSSPILSAVLSSLLLACGGASSAPAPQPSFGADGAAGDRAPAAATPPLATAESAQKQLRVEVRTAPDQPPARGNITALLTVKDAATGVAVEGLTIALVPWMPAMGHGSSVQPSVKAKGGGVYEAADCDLFMAGTWELRATFSGPVTDRATLSFEVR